MILRSMLLLIKLLGIPFIISADHNFTPEVLIASGWLNLLHVKSMRPVPALIYKLARCMIISLCTTPWLVRLVLLDLFIMVLSALTLAFH